MPAEAGETQEVGVVGMEHGFFLQDHRGDLSVGGEIASDAGVFQQPERIGHMVGEGSSRPPCR
mgnify:CR=1 FL=1